MFFLAGNTHMTLHRVSISLRSAITLTSLASRMGHDQMLRVSKVDGWLGRPRGNGPAPHRTQSAPGDCQITRASRVGDGRRGSASQRADGSGPSSGSPVLRLHLVLIPPGTRGTPHFHSSSETAFVYQVSGEAEVWHGA